MIGFAFGFVPYFDMGFSGKESDAIFCQNSKAYILGIEWDYCKNGLWKNTKGYLEELSKKDASLSDWWMHFVLAGTRSVAESFLTSFLFISYECIKASKIVANARIKAEQDKKTAEDLRIVAEKGKKTAEDLRIVAEKEKEKAELFRDALNHEEWFHFSSNIFSHAVEVVSNITQNSDKEEEQQLKTYLNGLAQLFRYKNAHS